ncbi:MAG: DNA polymerase III subunit gamma/tau [Pseudomonadales bacterium]|nr:DNA polymerase III subunit gamma/tau [Pseudomonadales bacterium]
MQYQVLARKWRPRTFQQMVGQEHVLKALVNALDQDRLHHAYLFTGTRGVGKTTIARILAKCLNCEEGVSSTPCNQCSSCLEINEGRCVDLIEVDAASRTKVEDTRELLDNVQYAPTRCRFKIYLIDEVHMLSSHSFNALLKTLEEPPPHIKFLLATTDPQKLPVTILSRCLQFNLKNLPPDAIVGHLKHVLAEENIAFEEAALWHLGRAADGSMRDALSLTDQAIAYGESKVHEAEVGAMLGSIDRGRVFHLLEALIAEDARQLLTQVADLAQYAPDYLLVLEELIGILHRIAVAQAVPDLTDNSFGDLEKIKGYAEQITAADLQLYYQIALIGRKDLPLNPDLRAGLEMVLLRMIAFRPDRQSPTSREPEAAEPEAKKKRTANSALASQSSPSVNNRQNSPLRKIQEEILGVNSTNTRAQRQAKPTLQPETGERPKLDLVINNRTEPEKETVPEISAENRECLSNESDQVFSTDVSETKAKPESGAEPLGQLKFEQVITNKIWVELALKLPIKGMSKNILLQCIYHGHQDETLLLKIDPQYFDLLNASHQERINHALTEYFGRPVRAKVEAGTSSEETPIGYQQRQQQERLHLATEALAQDPIAKEIVRRFDAVLDIDSIEPRN